MLDIEAKGEDDMETIMQFIEMMNDRKRDDSQDNHRNPPLSVEKPYVHPPLLASQPDDSFSLEEKTWFEFILSVMEPMRPGTR